MIPRDEFEESQDDYQESKTENKIVFSHTKLCSSILGFSLNIQIAECKSRNNYTPSCCIPLPTSQVVSYSTFV